jgi:hypothetical protein
MAFTATPGLDVAPDMPDVLTDPAPEPPGRRVAALTALAVLLACGMLFVAFALALATR